ncbi:MAG TPA: DUF4180 domain-containing protein [Clostridiales bacterium]|nr:DUF4180 domain-containing protein [Clostridiales bacterium]
MQIEKITENGVEIAHVTADGVLITDAQTAVDLMMTVKYEAGTKNIILAKELLADKFFILSSGLAGEILQKFVNYGFRIAIYGDYSSYTSKPLKAFIYESNKGNDVFFTDDVKSAAAKLTRSI